MIVGDYTHKYKHKLMVVGSIPFGINTYDFLKSFGSSVSFFDTNYKNWWNLPIKSLHYLLMLIKNDAVYKIGYFRPSAPYYLIARLLKKEIIVHWIGSEVLDLKKSHSWPIHGSFSVSNKLVNELDSYNIHSSWLPLFFPIELSDHFNYKSTISSHGVLFYMVKNQEEFYGLKYLLLLANNFKNVPFYLIGSSNMLFSNENIINMGYLNEQSLGTLFSRITLYVRITEHDGLSQLMLKSLLLGKEVITNTEHPFVNYFSPLSSNEKDLIQMMSQILDNKPKLNKDGINYVNEFYKPSIQFDRYQMAFNQIGIHL